MRNTTFVIVGLPDKAVNESRERVRSALEAAGGKTRTAVPSLTTATRVCTPSSGRSSASQPPSGVAP